MSESNEYDHAYGAIIGVIIGDACGATLKTKIGGNITEQIAKNAMTYPGGGMFRLAQAQYTDCTELMLSLASALTPNNPRYGFPTDDVAISYINWIKSRPFNIEMVFYRAFSSYKTYDSNLGKTISQHMMDVSLIKNNNSETNGALMRAIPIALWAFKESFTTIADLARQDAKLSHPSNVCQDCNAIYCMAQAYIIKYPYDSDGAIQMIEEYVINNPVNKRVHDWVLIDSKQIFTRLEGNFDSKQNMGSVKFPFVLSIYFLRNKTNFYDAILKTLMLGGDTSANAAIVGGMMGSYWGNSKVPLELKLPVNNFDCTKIIIKNDIEYAMKYTVVPRNIYIGYNRPSIYSTVNLYKKINDLLGLPTNNDNPFIR